MAYPSLLPSAWEIPDELRARLGERPGRQRAMAADGHLLLVLHAPPKHEEFGREGRFLWRRPDGSWSASGMTDGPDVLFALLDEYEQAIDRLHKEEDNAQGSYNYFVVLTQLAPLVRSTRNLHATLDQARQAVRTDRGLILARDRAYELMRQAELLYEHAKNVLEFEIARQAEQQAESSHHMAIAAHRLNLLAAFFFPIATLMAVFGANLRHGMEDWDTTVAPAPLIVVLGTGLVLGVALTWYVTRRARRDPAATRRWP